MVRDSRKVNGIGAGASRPGYKAVTRDLKAIYQAPTEEAGQQALEAFAAAWDCRYRRTKRPRDLYYTLVLASVADCVA